MKGAKQGGSRAKRLPVFVSPAELQFVGEDEASHKQILTLFNPYNFNIRFKVLSSAPHKYSVHESQGTLNPRCCTDLLICVSRIVYHRLASSGPYDVSDKFKIELFYNQRGSTTPIGLKFVISTLLKSKSGAQSFDEPTADGLRDYVSLSSHPHLPPSERRGLFTLAILKS
ncbi:Motile sperm domain-containing protein 1 [Geodia barretti]|uniref:Motile sperm domain-containing protein 1 n=1 Tax=Geodia barretti TaxID=519541 RepID=A0AA35WFE8_GEOBA|nr:Motile sperm domain-containing protein 1 [Geodia barretti]